MGVRIPFGVHICKLKGMGIRIPFGVHICKLKEWVWYLLVYTHVNWKEWVYVYLLVYICKLKGMGIRIPFGVHM